MAAEPAEQEIHEGHECRKRDQHRRDVGREHQSLAGAAGRRVEDVVVDALVGDLHGAERLGRARLGNRDFREVDRGGKAHQDGREEIARCAPRGEVGPENAARDEPHPAHHHDGEFRAGESGEVRPDHERSLRLPQKDRGGGVERFGTTRPEHTGRHPGERPHDQLHEPQVVEHREQRGREHDRGEHPKGEHEAGRTRRIDEPVAEHESRPLLRAGEHRLDPAARDVEGRPPRFEPEQEKSEQCLHEETPDHHPHGDRPPIFGERDHAGEDGRDAEQAAKSVEVFHRKGSG